MYNKYFSCYYFLFNFKTHLRFKTYIWFVYYVLNLRINHQYSSCSVWPGLTDLQDVYVGLQDADEGAQGVGELQELLAACQV